MGVGQAAGASARSWRTSAMGALAVTAAALLAGVPGTAEALGDGTGTDAVGPVIVSHLDGQQVSGAIVVTVQSSAPQVAIGLGTETDADLFEGTVTTHDGEASATLTTSGHHGPTALVARECASTGDCDGGAQTSVQVDVQNAPPAFAPGTWEPYVYGGRIVNVVEEGPWAWYGFFFDGEYVPPVLDNPWFSIGPGALDDGEHTIQVARCTRLSHEMMLEPPTCDMANASEVRSFTLVTALHPIVTDVRPRTITPNGDGVNESATVDVAVEAPHNLYWGLVRDNTTVASGHEVRTDAGPYSFTVSGLGSDGWTLPVGTYQLELYAYVPGTDVEGRPSTSLTVADEDPVVVDPPTDPTPTPLDPVVTSVRPRTISPNGDGVADASRVAVTVDAPHTLDWKLLRGTETVASGHQVRTAAGPYSFTLDGLGTDGQALPNGTYELKLSATDAEGRRTGEASTTLIVDGTPPRVTEPSVSPQTFYPRVDGFRDRVRIRGQLSEPVSRLRVELMRSHRLRRTLRVGAHDAGAFATTWDGHLRNGGRAAAGTYRYRFVVTDRHGNEGTHPGGWLTLRAGS